MKIIWNSDTSPKENMMLWKVLNQALLTRDVLIRYGLNHGNLCFFCGVNNETCNHIFFNCDVNFLLWRRLMTMSGPSDFDWNMIYNSTRWKTSGS